MSLVMSLIILFLFLPYTCTLAKASAEDNKTDKYEFCQPTNCSNRSPSIRYPFRLKTQPTSCGLEGFELSCLSDKTILHLPSSGDYYVHEISYLDSSITITDVNETACPFQRLFSFHLTNSKFFGLSTSSYALLKEKKTLSYALCNCTEKAPPKWTSYEAIGPINCFSNEKNLVYAIDSESSMEDMLPSCRKSRTENLVAGYCYDGEGKTNGPGPLSISLISTGASIGGITLFALVIFIIYRSREYEKEKETQLKVEKFLENYRTVNPTRYTYKELKKITSRFKHRLGQGGYGSVFRGKLFNGTPVAVKMLEHLKGNGQEFINEVATIGRIHHFHIVRLLGFCSEGNRPARGTSGYIAPELFSRNFGEISYKSDVYSYGMMLLEMVGCRKNNDPAVEIQSQIYFPEWIYNRMREGQELCLDFEEDGDEGIARKLAIVALWCIQWNPTERPSMPMVLQMLEADLQSLEIPPMPFVAADVEAGAIN
ncbi:hypothetical protein WN944_010540 [Citrus x changshan-huyou]|uniref:Protein kinase domain-containing protein n=1 Tax=Citrus x changshan-huyou TaxID=2935761 RepID=A0AAP0MWK6_9ROSI